MEKAVALAPQAADYRYNFGRVLAAKGDLPAAVVQFEEAAKLTSMQEPAILEMLAATYSDTGRYSEAVSTARRALELAVQQQNDALGGEVEGEFGEVRRAGAQWNGTDRNAVNDAPARPRWPPYKLARPARAQSRGCRRYIIRLGSNGRSTTSSGCRRRKVSATWQFQQTG